MFDGLFDYDMVLEIEELFIDIGGVSDYVFVLFCLIGKCFVLCFCNIKDWKLYIFEKVDIYLVLVNYIGVLINIVFIMDYWDEFLCFVVLIMMCIVVLLVIFKKFFVLLKFSDFVKVLCEFGCIECILFMIEWYFSLVLCWCC